VHALMVLSQKFRLTPAPNSRNDPHKNSMGPA